MRAISSVTGSKKQLQGYCWPWAVGVFPALGSTLGPAPVEVVSLEAGLVLPGQTDAAAAKPRRQLLADS